MPDVASISQALTSLKTATEIVRALRLAESSLEKAELKFKIADLAEALATARLSVLDAQEEIQSLQAKIDKLESLGDLRTKLERRDNVYYFKEPVEGRDSGPYCPRCLEADAVLIHVTELAPSFRVMARFECPKCQQKY